MITWKRDPRLQDLNIRADMAHRVERDAFRRSAWSWKDLGEATGEDVAAASATHKKDESVWKEHRREFLEAAQTAVDAIIPTLTDEERAVLTVLSDNIKSEFPGHDSPDAGELWRALQDVEFCIAVLKDDYDAYIEAGHDMDYDHGTDAYRYVGQTDTHRVYHVDTLSEAHHYGVERIGFHRAVKYSGLSPDELAKRAHVPADYVSKLCTGIEHIDKAPAAYVKRLSEVLEVPMEDLVKCKTL